MLVFYRGETGSYIESCDIDYDLNIMNVSPISENTLEQLSSLLHKAKPKKKEYISMFVPENLLYMSNYFGKYELIWYVKNHCQYIKFTNEEVSGDYHVPTTIFHYKGGKLSLYVTNEKVVTKETKIYSNPYPNSYDDNGICFGNCKLNNNGNILDIIKEYTDFLFESSFSVPFSEELTHFWNIAKKRSMPPKFYESLKHIGKIKNLIQ